MQFKSFNTAGLLSLLALGLAGCTQHYNYKSDTFRDTANGYLIDVTMRKDVSTGISGTAVSVTATLSINKNMILQGDLDEEQSGTLYGTYEGEKLVMECSKDAIHLPALCFVSLDGAKIAEVEVMIRSMK